jgi:hypothetical protein
MDAAGNTVKRERRRAGKIAAQRTPPGKVPAIEARPHRGLMLRWDWGDRAPWPT